MLLFRKSHIPVGPVCIKVVPPWLGMCFCEFVDLAFDGNGMGG